MFKIETLPLETRVALESLSQENLLEGITLIGGTALSLQLGHRISVDIDFISGFNDDQQLPTRELEYLLKTKYGFDVKVCTNTSLIAIHEAKKEKEKSLVKIDYRIEERRAPIEKPFPFGVLSIASIPDIIAMKLAAIGSGTKEVKHFFDIATLSEKYTLNQMIDFYTAAYKDQKEMQISSQLALIKMPLHLHGEVILLEEKKIIINHLRQRMLDMLDHPNKTFMALKHTSPRKGLRL